MFQVRRAGACGSGPRHTTLGHIFRLPHLIGSMNLVPTAKNAQAAQAVRRGISTNEPYEQAGQRSPRFLPVDGG